MCYASSCWAPRMLSCECIECQVSKMSKVSNPTNLLIKSFFKVLVGRKGDTRLRKVSEELGNRVLVLYRCFLIKAGVDIDGVEVGVLANLWLFEGYYRSY